MEENHDRTRLKHDKIHISTWQNPQCWVVTQFRYYSPTNLVAYHLLYLQPSSKYHDNPIIIFIISFFVGDTAITMARQLQSESRKRVLDTKKFDLKELGTVWNVIVCRKNDEASGSTRLLSSTDSKVSRCMRFFSQLSSFPSFATCTTKESLQLPSWSSGWHS